MFSKNKKRNANLVELNEPTLQEESKDDQAH